MSIKKYFNSSFLYVLCALVAILFLPKIFQKGMFMDGLIYGAISLNLSEGIGSFWTPWYNGLDAHTFEGHMPLFFWLQSAFFAVFGNHFFTERVFTFVLFLISLTLVFKIQNTKNGNMAAIISAIFIAITPKVVWCFDNNMLETLLVPIALFSFWIIQQRQKLKKAWQIPLFAFMCLLFFLVKGPVVLAVLTMPIFFFRNLKSGLIDFFYGLLCFIILLGILSLSESANTFIIRFFELQVFPSMRGERVSENSSFQLKIIAGLLEQIIIPVALLLIIFIFTKSKPTFTKNALPFLFAGLMFSVPFTLFKKQHIYYILPSFTFFSIYLASLISDNAAEKVNQFLEKHNRPIKIISAISIIIAFTLSIKNYDSPARSASLHFDIPEIANITGNQPVSVSSELKENWELFAYSSRFKLVDFDKAKNNLYLVSKKKRIVNYDLVPLGNEKYFLHKRID